MELVIWKPPPLQVGLRASRLRAVSSALHAACARGLAGAGGQVPGRGGTEGAELRVRLRPLSPGLGAGR